MSAAESTEVSRSPMMAMNGTDTSPALGKLAAALAKAQAVLPAVEKDRTVKVQTKSGGEYGYSYATLAAVLDTVRGPFAANGLSFVQLPNVGQQGVTVTTMLLHESGEYIRTTLVMPLNERTPQAIGSAITYGRRYSIQSLAGVAAEEDDDAGAAQGKTQTVRERRQPASQPQRQQAAAPPQKPTPAAAEQPKPPTVVDVHDGETEELAKARTAAATPSGFFARALHLAKSKGGWEEHNVRNWLKVKRGRNAASEVTAEDVVALGLALEPPAAEGAKQ